MLNAVKHPYPPACEVRTLRCAQADNQRPGELAGFTNKIRIDDLRPNNAALALQAMRGKRAFSVRGQMWNNLALRRQPRW